MKVAWTEPRRGRHDVIALFEDRGCEVQLGNDYENRDAKLSSKELLQLLDGTEVLLTGSRDRLTRDVIAASPQLRAICKSGIGVNNIDVDAATSAGVVVTNTPIPEDFRAVAEGTVARMLALAKQLKRFDGLARQSDWTRGGNLYLYGKTVGLVGFGRVARFVADFVRPYDVNILVSDPYVNSETLPPDVTLCELDVLLEQADIISLHAVATSETAHLISEESLRLVKPSVLLVNTARGALLDEKALATALRDNRVRGAALDVFETEPLDPSNPLLESEFADRLLLSPHSACSTPEAAYEMPLAMARCGLQALEGVFPEYPVNPEVEDRWLARFQ